MAETLYIITTGGEILAVNEVTALALDNTFTIQPGDYYRNEWIEQADTIHDNVLTLQKGDQATAAPLRTESWLCSFWKFTRGAALPILYHKWADVMAICNLPPNVEAEGALYIPLVNGQVAVYSGIAASTTAIAIDSDQTIYPGDYYRNRYLEQVETIGGANVLTDEKGDAADGDALNSESWVADHYSIARSGLLTLYVPFSWVRSGPSTTFPSAA